MSGQSDGPVPREDSGPVSTDPGGAHARMLDDRPLIGVELRPPRTGLSHGESMDRWIDMHDAMGRLARHDTVTFLTDSAIGEPEEENLRHLSANLPAGVDRRRVVPFLTCKHSLDYCRLYASRAAAEGFEAVTVLGGDRSIGPPRCVPHAADLRRDIRSRLPGLRLGGWANPLRDPVGQADLLSDPAYEVDFFLTQIVSHHDLAPVERFLEILRRRGIRKPGVFGVFFYRSSRPSTLRRLGEFFPVPAQALTREFDEGLSPIEICARTVRALRDLGIAKVYVSNLGLQDVGARYDRLTTAAGR
jgi:hypothetical protein